MADDVERKAGRAVGRGLTLAVVVIALLAWAAVPGSGWYRLNPGEAAVILRLGRHVRTVRQEGINLKLPTPIETVEIVNVGVSQRREFGNVDAKQGPELAETEMQTGDNNIVLVEFVVQYRIGDPFIWKYRAHDVDHMLGDAAQAAMREVVGRNTIDGVLSERRGVVQDDAADLLEQLMETYQTGLQIETVELQEVQPPAAVRAAFDDVIAAKQDSNRKVNEAQGYANEVLPKAQGEAKEVAAQAAAYHDAKIARAQGDSQRFLALLAEYKKAPAITRERLYLETMEQVLPNVRKILIAPGTAVPYLPLAPQPEPRREPRPAPKPAPKAEGK